MIGSKTNGRFARHTRSIRPASWLAAAWALTIAAALSQVSAAHAQDTTARNPRGVRIGLNYGPGTRPGVLVAPIERSGGDSIRTIIQRDLDFSDRVTVIALDSAAMRKVIPLKGKVNLPLLAKFGASVLLRATASASGLRVAAYDVAKGKLIRSGDFPLPPSRGTSEWRFAVHGVSDSIEEWLLGVRGIAQSRIAFVHGGNLRVIDSDGAGLRTVKAGPGALSPSWAPDGKSIVYSLLGNAGTQIQELSLGTGVASRISSVRPGLNITPVVSPDGWAIVYARGGAEGSDLVMLDRRTGEQHRLTVGGGSDNTSPSFSPDGRQVAYISARSGHPQMYIIDADGSNAQLLTGYEMGERSYRSSPDWSPDGRAIAYEQQNGDFQIWTIDLRDRLPKQLTTDAENEDPSWAPDSRHIVLTSTRGGDKQLWVLDTETGRFRQLTRARGARLASWSPILALRTQP